MLVERGGIDTKDAEGAREALRSFQSKVEQLRHTLHTTIVGQEEAIDSLLICALTGNHALLVGVPGLAKTLLVKSLAASFDWSFNRVQFTPDLMPADITGYELLAAAEGERLQREMIFRRGPIFTNLLLADEINRAPPKTQSALLEAMAELHVSVGGKRHDIAPPFLVVATQNPIEQEGTYPLPEAQLDRFMMEIRIPYPPREQEEEIVRRTTAGPLRLPGPMLDVAGFLALRELVWAVPAPESVIGHAVALCGASRPGDSRASTEVTRFIQWGAGPRGAQCLVLAAKARALILGRTAPVIEDVRSVAGPILRHRIIPSYRASAEGLDRDTLVQNLVRTVPA